jgi:hypothetical protein
MALKYFFMENNILSQRSELIDLLIEMLRSPSQFFMVIAWKMTEVIGLKGKGFFFSQD